MVESIKKFLDVLKNNAIDYEKRFSPDDFEDYDNYDIHGQYSELEKESGAGEDNDASIMDAKINGFTRPFDLEDFLEILFREFSSTFIEDGYKNTIDRCNGLALRITYIYNDLVQFYSQVYPQFNSTINEMIRIKIKYAANALRFIERNINIENYKRDYYCFYERNFNFSVFAPDTIKDDIDLVNPDTIYYRVCYINESQDFSRNINAVFEKFTKYLDDFIEYNNYDESRHYILSVLNTLNTKYNSEKERFLESAVANTWKGISEEKIISSVSSEIDIKGYNNKRQTAFANLYEMTRIQIEYIDKIINHIAYLKGVVESNNKSTVNCEGEIKQTVKINTEVLNNDVELEYIDRVALNEKEYWTTNEVAAFLEKKTSTIYQYTSKNLIPFYKIGNSNLFKPEEIREWVNNNRKRTLKELQAEADIMLNKKLH